ncbi:DUF3617 family protein [Sphingomonas sp.]|uniref:DUF3617 domain-containing protein n=1 Tax=Sphingomonas sp. TaxID=28214 RepID=UPI00286D951F|nr:DUF3617 family protein [Sphingomonas sp.]
MRVSGLKIVVAGLLCALAACGGDPAAEAPITVTPGLYEASLTGRGNSPFFMAAPAALDKRVCVTADEAQHFPQMYARKYLAMEGACGGPLAERAGNRISGKVVCPFERGSVIGELTTEFDGTVSAEAVAVEAVSKLAITGGDGDKRARIEDSALAKDGVDLKLDIRRVGDC